ncbi:MAG: hypothetical protein MJ249_09555 [Kiritimatiellae bacterium]|nr:hypothetical protein [Kiritimatiellia bacterium]
MNLALGVLLICGCERGTDPELTDGNPHNAFAALDVRRSFDFENYISLEDLVVEKSSIESAAIHTGSTLLIMDARLLRPSPMPGFEYKRVYASAKTHEVKVIEFVKELGAVNERCARKIYGQLCNAIGRQFYIPPDIVRTIGADIVEMNTWMSAPRSAKVFYDVLLCKNDDLRWRIELRVAKRLMALHRMEDEG